MKLSAEAERRTLAVSGSVRMHLTPPRSTLPAASKSPRPSPRPRHSRRASSFVYIDLPDFGLTSLQGRFHTPELESLYKRYEQRSQIGETKREQIHRRRRKAPNSSFGAGTLSTYLVLQCFICVLYIVLSVVFWPDKSDVSLEPSDRIPDIAGQSCLLAMCLAMQVSPAGRVNLGVLE